MLGKIRAELRSSVFSAIQEERSETSAEPATLRELKRTADGRLALELVREFLVACGLDYTAAVLTPEANLAADAEPREDLASKLKLDVAGSAGERAMPLIYDLVRARAHAAPSVATRAAEPSAAPPPPPSSSAPLPTLASSGSADPPPPKPMGGKPLGERSPLGERPSTSEPAAPTAAAASSAPLPPARVLAPATPKPLGGGAAALADEPLSARPAASSGIPSGPAELEPPVPSLAPPTSAARLGSLRPVESKARSERPQDALDILSAAAGSGSGSPSGTTPDGGAAGRRHSPGTLDPDAGSSKGEDPFLGTPDSKGDSGSERSLLGALPPLGGKRGGSAMSSLAGLPPLGGPGHASAPQPEGGLGGSALQPAAEKKILLPGESPDDGNEEDMQRLRAIERKLREMQAESPPPPPPRPAQQHDAASAKPAAAPAAAPTVPPREQEAKVSASPRPAARQYAPALASPAPPPQPQP